MITSLFLQLTNYPVFRRLIWKPIYELLAKKFRSKDWSLMNYGYAPCNDEPFLKLDKEDEVNRFLIHCIIIWHRKYMSWAAKSFEVGSGRGGGASYIEKYLKPRKIVGVDITINAVKLANEYFGSATISFVQGSAEQLPIEDESYDVVINIDSSHTYGSVPVFLAEVKRVLRRGGYLVCADIRTAADSKIIYSADAQ